MPSLFIERLHQLLSAEPMRKKIILTSSHAQGLQWLEQITRAYGKVEHTEVKTVESYIFQLTKFKLYQKGLRYESSQQAFWIIHHMMLEMAKQADALVPENLLTPGMVQRFAEAINDLREAGVRSEALRTADFETTKKREYLQELLARYEKVLAEKKLADFTALVSLLNEGSSKIEPIERPLLLMHDQLLVTPFLRSALEKAAGPDLIKLSSDPAFTNPSSSFPFQDCAFFHATGSLAEIRNVFRIMAERSIPCDQVEIIMSDPALYTRTVYHLANQLELPCSFAEGLPIGVTTIGQAAQMYVRWLESDFHAELLVYGIRQGWVRFPAAEPEVVSSDLLADELEKSGVGWWKERYALLEKKAKVETDPQKQRTLKLLNQFFNELLNPYSNCEAASPEQIWSGLVGFLERYVPKPNEREQSVFNAIKEGLQALTNAFGDSMPMERAITFIQKMLDELRCDIQPVPKPINLFVSILRSGGHSGRPYTFIVGMDENAWNIRSRQDPVLLDEERRRIDSGLFTSADLAAHKAQERDSRLTMIGGKVTLSFCSYEIVGNEEKNPAFEMLQLYRNQTGRSQASAEDLLHSMGKPVHYTAHPNLPLDVADSWLGKLTDRQDRLLDGKAAVHQFYPFLREGEKAAQSRTDIAISEFDGMIDTSRFPIRYLSGGKALSPSRMEMFASCPLQFFYQAVLGFYPKDKAEFDRSQWLDPLQKGSLLHRVFECYMSETANRKTDADQRHDRTRLSEITEQVLLEFSQEIPAPSVAVWKKECDQIRRDAEVFFNMEIKRTTTPKFFELPLHNGQEAFQLEMGSELVFPLRGIVDRVDEIAPNQYKILDYKTGSVYKYRKNEHFGGGTLLQHALYAWAVEQWLQKNGVDPSASVLEAAYVFPTIKGMGEEVSLTQTKRAELKELLQHMLAAMEQGVFPPTDDSGNCRWCDYKAACGSHAEWMKDKREAAENSDRLAHLLEVNGYA